MPPLLQDKRIIVTGGCGFIGSHLVEALCRDNKVIVVDNLSTGTLDNLAGFDVELVRRDITEPLDEVFAGAQIVFHTAALVEVSTSVRNPAIDARTNVMGLLSVLNASRTAGIERLVFSSSTAVYGVARHLPVDESHPTDPISPYGLSKLTGERYFHMFHALEGFPAVCLRYFNVYGQRQRASSPYSGVISIFAQNRLLDRPSVIYGDGEQSRDFVHVSDVVRANLMAAAAPAEAAAGRTFNVGTGREITLNDLVRLLGLPAGKVEYASARPGDIRRSVADVRQIEWVLGFKAEVGIEQGLADYLAWRARDLSATAPSSP